jgi:hypothetical protein
MISSYNDNLSHDTQRTVIDANSLVQTFTAVNYEVSIYVGSRQDDMDCGLWTVGSGLLTLDLSGVWEIKSINGFFSKYHYYRV